MSTERVWLFQIDHSIFLAKKMDSGKHLSGYTIGGNIRLLTKSNHDAKLFIGGLNMQLLLESY